MNPAHEDRETLRRRMKRLRRAVPPAQRRRAAAAVARQVRHFLNLRPGLRVAIYAPLPSELDAGAVTRLVRCRGCRVYLPRLTDLRRRRMQFIEASGPMRRNHLGILEPIRIRRISARNLDLVFVPLVAFDARGMRLGMGAGYYDRAFAFLTQRTAWIHPRLVGLAYAFQQVPYIDGAAHDVLLHAVITDEGSIKCSSGS